MPPAKLVRRVPAFDGLRGAAIVGVMLFHLPTRSVFKGGYIGVEVFFALSGFLITALVLREIHERGGLDLPSFGRRRVARLLPALVAFLGLYVAAAALFGRTTWFASDPFGAPRGRPVSVWLAARGAMAGLTYTLNMVRAGHHALPPIDHLWSLSVEGQFYVAWPLLLVALVRWAPRWLASVTGALIVVSACLPFALWRGGAGADMVYFSSLPSAQGLFVGALGAQLWSRGRMDVVPQWLRNALSVLAASGVAVMIFCVGNQPFKYLGSQSTAALAGTLLVMHCADAPRTPILGNRAMVWLGQRSYAIYLWHYVFACWTNPLSHDVGVPITIIAALVAGELSWRMVELPAQRWLRARRRRAPAHTPALATRPEALVA